MSARRLRIRAGAEERAALTRLVPEGESAGGELCDAVAAGGAGPDALLARVVWCRLIEPGDAVAGTLIEALGASPALDVLAGDEAPQRLAEAAAAVGVEITRRSLAAAIARWRPRLDRPATIADLDRAVAAGLQVIVPESPLWPTALNDLGVHAPQVLWVRGDATALARTGLAVVGARACTGYGTSVTAELVDAAGSAGFSIVSGAAYGIDAVAHRAALAAGAPTVAVLAGGADRAYPASHEKLLDRIAAEGAVCSEMVPGAAPTRWRFLQRNRSIAALATATLVTEAGMRSGSLNTAGHAAELGRSLGAVPGPVTSAASAGCHRLIRDYGATLVTNADELREFLGLGDAAGQLLDGLCERQSAAHRRVLDALPLRGHRSAEDVALAAGLVLEEVRAVLAELELIGFAVRVETGRGAAHWRLVRRE
ncbi:DNA-processing protein DprA [Leucobacter sp. USCH14]|uniref:DNA-processing protein DprA n=1 Tax=Leucobacter sp. USCH14 TaxID=3024838 RepID=UPI0030ADB7F7